MSLAKILKKAQQGGWAIGQFNFSCLEQLKAIVLAAQEWQSPVILGTSEGEARFFGLKEAVVLKDVLAKKSGLKLFLHLDHGRDLDYIEKAIAAGYDSVQFDGSDLSWQENVRMTKKVVAMAKKKVLVEGELGYLRGSSQPHLKKIKISQEDLTKPEQASELVKKTGVDSLAIAIGNIHGIYAQAPQLDFERLKEIRKKTDAFLVLHGGSGISSAGFKKAIKLGIVKININTELRVLWKKELLRSLSASKSVKPYQILPKAIDKIKNRVKERIELFGSQRQV